MKRRRNEGKEEKIGDQITKKKKKSLCASFSSARSSFDQSEMRYLEKTTLYLLLFSCKIFSMNKL